MIYEFGEFELDEDRGELRRAGAVVHLEPKPFALLRHLIRHRKRVVTKAELLDHVWPDVAVGEGSLSSAIRSIRRALEDSGAEQRYVRTLRRRGFHFCGTVREKSIRATRGSSEGSASLDVFEGRVDLLTRLEQMLEEASRGRGWSVLLTGEPGIGKTRTAEELLRRAGERSDPVLALNGWCPAEPGAAPYWPWLRILRGLGDAVGDEALRGPLRSAASELTRLIPEIGSRAPELTPMDDSSRETSRFRLFDAIGALLREAAADRTVLVVLDDLQWADRSSLRLLEFIAREIVQTRVLLLVTLREDEIVDGHPACDALDALGRAGRSERIALRGLDRDEIGAMLQHLGNASLTEERITEIAVRSGGNPFFARELALAAPSIAIEPAEHQPATVPPLLEKLLNGRMHHLGVATVEVLETAAVAGAGFEAQLIAEAIARPVLQVDAALERASRASMVHRDTQRGRWRFAHALIQDAVEAGIAEDRTRELHLRIAEAIESLHRDDLDSRSGELAHHFGAALPIGDREVAVAWAARAGDVAYERFAFDEAVSHHEHAARLHEQGGDPLPGRAGQLAYSLAQSLACAGQSSRALDTYLRAGELAVASADAVLLADASLGAVDVSWDARRDSTAECLPLLEKALAALPADDLRRRSLITARLAETPMWSDEEREHLAFEALSIAEYLHDNYATAQALAACHTLRFKAGLATERLELATRLVRACAATGHAGAEFEAHRLRYGDLLALGRVLEADAELAAVEACAERSRQPTKRAIPQLGRAGRALWQGRFDEAETLAADALARLGRDMPSQAAQIAGSQMLCLRAFQGRLAEIAPQLGHISEGSLDAAAWRCARAWLQYRLGRAEAARRDLEAMLPDAVELPLDQNRLAGLAMLSEVAAGLADRERCVQLQAELEPEAGLYLTLGDNMLLGCVSRPLGLLARSIGCLDEAENHLRVAIDAEDRIGARPWAAETRLEYATLLLAWRRHGDSSRAVTLLAEAEAIATELGMVPLAKRIDAVRP